MPRARPPSPSTPFPSRPAWSKLSRASLRPELPSYLSITTALTNSTKSKSNKLNQRSALRIKDPIPFSEMKSSSNSIRKTLAVTPNCLLRSMRAAILSGTRRPQPTIISKFNGSNHTLTSLPMTVFTPKRLRVFSLRATLSPTRRSRMSMSMIGRRTEDPSNFELL